MKCAVYRYHENYNGQLDPVTNKWKLDGVTCLTLHPVQFMVNEKCKTIALQNNNNNNNNIINNNNNNNNHNNNNNNMNRVLSVTSKPFDLTTRLLEGPCHSQLPLYQ